MEAAESANQSLEDDDDDSMEVQASYTEHNKNLTNVDAFYDTLRPSNYSHEVEQPKGLTNSLFPYQRKAVAWMLHRETMEGVGKDGNKELKFPDVLKNCKGGILADEMGLGKTLEVLSLVLLNPRNHSR